MCRIVRGAFMVCSGCVASAQNWKQIATLVSFIRTSLCCAAESSQSIAVCPVCVPKPPPPCVNAALTVVLCSGLLYVGFVVLGFCLWQNVFPGRPVLAALGYASCRRCECVAGCEGRCRVADGGGRLRWLQSHRDDADSSLVWEELAIKPIA